MEGKEEETFSLQDEGLFFSHFLGGKEGEMK